MQVYTIMMTIIPLISEFTAIGELQDLTVKSDGRVKYLLLSSNKEEYLIKVTKDQPKNLGEQLKLGSQLKVKGMVKHKIKKDEVEYKAYSIKLLTSPAVAKELPKDMSPTKSGKSQKSKAKVLICKKSNCWNKGGKKVCQQLMSELENKGIKEQVEIKTTGCLKKCKQAPNMIVLPNKKQYIKVKPKEIVSIVNKHFA